MTPASAALPAAAPVRIDLHLVEVPLVAPIRAAHGVEEVRRSILVQATDDAGTEGWGECVALARPTYTSEWIDGAWAILRDELVPAALSGRASATTGHPMAAAAVEGALVDLALRREGRSLASALGVRCERVVSRAVVGLHDSTSSLVDAVAARLERGHRAAKVKIVPAGAVDALVALRSTWPDLDLAVDANGSLDIRRDADLLARLDGLGLSYVEQPFAATDLVSHAALRRGWTTPIALDESIVDGGTLSAAHALGALDLVNLKPARLGGLIAAVGLHDQLVSLGLGAFCGGMYELGVARAAALVLAGRPGLDAPTDLGPSDAYVTRDVTAPFVLGADGTIELPTGPGIGRAPDRARLDEVSVDRWVGEVPRPGRPV